MLLPRDVSLPVGILRIFLSLTTMTDCSMFRSATTPTRRDWSAVEP